MSQANVDVLRRFNDAFRLGDWVALAALMDPHVHIRTDPAWPEEEPTDSSPPPPTSQELDPELLLALPGAPTRTLGVAVGLAADL